MAGPATRGVAVALSGEITVASQSSYGLFKLLKQIVPSWHCVLLLQMFYRNVCKVIPDEFILK